jgi:hypothetical protein
MKKSELKQIIQEEVKSILEAEDPINAALKKAIGFVPPTGGKGNRLGLPLEKLPTYNDLPETDKEVPRKDMRYIDIFILVPNIGAENGFLYSKEKAKKWVDTYKSTYNGEEPRFTTERISIAGKDNIVRGTLVSDEYLAHQKRIKDYEESPEYQEAVQRFYDSLKYKGD